jgi:hypothetical protein
MVVAKLMFPREVLMRPVLATLVVLVPPVTVMVWEIAYPLLLFPPAIGKMAFAVVAEFVRDKEYRIAFLQGAAEEAVQQEKLGAKQILHALAITATMKITVTP